MILFETENEPRDKCILKRVDRKDGTNVSSRSQTTKWTQFGPPVVIDCYYILLLLRAHLNIYMDMGEYHNAWTREHTARALISAHPFLSVDFRRSTIPKKKTFRRDIMILIWWDGIGNSLLLEVI